VPSSGAVASLPTPERIETRMRGQLRMLVVAASMVLSGGCNRGGAADGGLVCASFWSCDAGLLCVGNQCVAECSDVPGWTSCDTYNGEGISHNCCSPAEHCCYMGYEYYRCRPLDEPCPIDCGGWTVCSADTLCNTGPSGGLDSYGCVFSHTKELFLECTADCPSEQQCGSLYCCLGGTRCAAVNDWRSCCVLDDFDGGPADAPGDAVPD
jgi:hypothetical protein